MLISYFPRRSGKGLQGLAITPFLRGAVERNEERYQMTLLTDRTTAALLGQIPGYSRVISWDREQGNIGTCLRNELKLFEGDNNYFRAILSPDRIDLATYQLLASHFSFEQRIGPADDVLKCQGNHREALTHPFEAEAISPYPERLLAALAFFQGRESAVLEAYRRPLKMEPSEASKNAALRRLRELCLSIRNDLPPLILDLGFDCLETSAREPWSAEDLLELAGMFRRNDRRDVVLLAGPNDEDKIFGADAARTLDDWQDWLKVYRWRTAEELVGLVRLGWLVVTMDVGTAYLAEALGKPRWLIAPKDGFFGKHLTPIPAGQGGVMVRPEDIEVLKRILELL